MATITQISSGTDLSGLTGTKISAPSGSATSGTSAATDKAKQLKNQFLSILLTQMQHQNPLDPMDTKEFTGQLTQFSALEQQIDTNTKLDSLLSATTQSSLTTAFAYIGQKVDIASASTSVQNGDANWTYAIPEDAKSVAVSVTDSTGKILYSANMTNGAGGSGISKGTYSLDLKNADLTRAAADGEVLKISITAKNNANAAITADVHTAVKVDSIQSDKTGTYLQAGGLLFGIADVKRIVNSTPVTTTTA